MSLRCEKLVSIIIPIFNRASLIGETLDSLVLQSYHDWECILVDDGSTDNIKEVLQPYLQDARFRFYQRTADRKAGGNAARNYGFEMSRGTYVNWFDSDDVMHPDFIRLKKEELDKNPHFTAVISRKAAFRDSISNIISHERRTRLTDNYLEDFLLINITWFLPDVMWRRWFLEGRELFNEELLSGQDRDFHIRMMLFNPTLTVIEDYLTYCRLHENNITSSLNNVHQGKLKISSLQGMSRLFVLLEKSGKLSFKVRMFYFRFMIKYLPFVVNSKDDFRVLVRVLKRLSFWHPKIARMWIQFSLSLLSFKLFGKGLIFLKYPK